MSAFSAVAEALANWPRPVTASEGGTAGRLLAAIGRLGSAPDSVGPWDLAGLVGQLLREEKLHARTNELRLRVPTARPWPDRLTWERHGIEVRLHHRNSLHLAARSWKPDWLPGASSESPIAATLRREVRGINSAVACDPVWTDLLGMREYLSPGQRDAVRASLLLEAGRSLLVLLPTGGGKTMVAHAAALLAPEQGSTTVFVVPTVALALDQERRAAEVFSRFPVAAPPSFAYHSGLHGDEKRALKDRIANGRQPLVIASPEAVVQALRSSLLQCARRGGLRTIVVDEAHVVSQWGNEFRPDFQAVAAIRRLLVRASPAGAAPRTILLTATLTQDGWRTLRVLFGTPSLEFVAAVNLRPEPDYYVSTTADPASRESRVLETICFAPRPLILYTSLPEDADRWHDRLWQLGLRRLGKIHGETADTERRRLLTAWTSAEIDVMVATSAFGLGVDKADVRTVVHACVPETLDRYYQEVGRGGRDGRACVSLLIHAPADMGVARSLNEERLVGLEKGLLRWRTMFHNAGRSEGSDTVLVRLDSVPAHLRSTSRANAAWNLRTLLLMARAGLIELESAEPPLIDQQEGESDEDFEERQHQAFARNAISIAVRPTGLGHLDRDTWERRVELARQETLRSDRRSLNQVERFLGGTESLADLLIEAYTLDADGIGISPARVDGNCPVSRGGVMARARFILPESQLHLTVATAVDGRFARLLPPDSHYLLVAVPAPGRHPASDWRRALLPALRMLVSRGVREIRAVPSWLELPEYRSLYRSARPRIVFHSNLVESPPSLADEWPVPRLTVIEGGIAMVDFLASAALSRRPLELLLVPEDLPDPERPDRPLIAVRESIPLSRLRTELN